MLFVIYTNILIQDTVKDRKLVKDYETGLWMIKKSNERPKIPYRDMHGFKIITNLEPDNPLLQMPNEKATSKYVDRKVEATKHRRDWAFQDPRTGPSFRDFVSKN